MDEALDSRIQGRGGPWNDGLVLSFYRLSSEKGEASSNWVSGPERQVPTAISKFLEQHPAKALGRSRASGQVVLERVMTQIRNASPRHGNTWEGTHFTSDCICPSLMPTGRRC